MGWNRDHHATVGAGSECPGGHLHRAFRLLLGADAGEAPARGSVRSSEEAVRPHRGTAARRIAHAEVASGAARTVPSAGAGAANPGASSRFAVDAKHQCAIGAANRKLTRTESAGDLQQQKRRALEHDLRLAVQARELTVHYQPLVEIASRQIMGLEALVRWTHPTLGSIPPSEFIPVAEESGLIVPLGELVLRKVCEQLACWAQEEVPGVRVAVNLSAVQLERQSIRELVRSILRDTRVQIEIDDFGTGYSSLSCLKQLPVDTLKIDRSFIRHLDTNGSDEAIVRAILTLARNLRLRVVAEGVETPAQLRTTDIVYGHTASEDYAPGRRPAVNPTQWLSRSLARWWSSGIRCLLRCEMQRSSIQLPTESNARSERPDPDE